MSTPKDGKRTEGTPGAPRERSAAGERAMRRRSRREQHAAGTDRNAHTDRAARTDRNARTDATPRTSGRTERATRTERAGRSDRPAGARPAGRARTERGKRLRPSVDRGVPTRRRVLVRRSVALSSVIGLVVIVVAALWTPLLGVRSVDVTGEHLLTADQVRVAAQVESGTPMLRLDTDAIRARVHQLARVATVDVSREWPSTVRIDITERDPVGVMVERDGAHLVDDTGLDYATLAVAPTGLPRIQVTSPTPDDPRIRAIVRVLAALPAQLRGLVGTVSAKTPGSVTLGLTHGRTIRWGNADDSARKAAVLAALMTRPGRVYDVSSPDLPTIS